MKINISLRTPKLNEEHRRSFVIIGDAVVLQTVIDVSLVIELFHVVFGFNSF